MRRMLGFLVLIGVVASMIALAMTALAYDDHTGQGVVDCEAINKHDGFQTCEVPSTDLVVQVKAHEVVATADVNYQLDWGKAILLTKQGFDFRLLAVPTITQKAQELTMLYVYINPDGSVKRAAVFTTKETGQNEMEVSFLTGDGAVISGAVFREGKFVRRLDDGVELEGYWDCWRACMRRMWSQMPDELKWICGSSCGACIWSGKLWTCPICALCAGFWGGVCDGLCS